jgi:quinol monooxygenase YgiN
MPHEVIAIIRVKPEAIEIARPQIVALIEASRKEEGVLRYDWYHDAHEVGTFIVLETYVDHHAAELHRASEHFKHVIANSGAWIAAPIELRILKPEYVKQ